MRLDHGTDDTLDAPDQQDVEGHRLAANVNETIVVAKEPDDIDVEGHRLASNVNETIVVAKEPAEELDGEGQR